MVKKLQKMAQKKAANPATSLLDNPIAQAVKEQAEHIWLAGMGAFSKIQAEGAKGFEQLMKQGAALQKKTQGAAEEHISSVTSKMSAVAGGVGEKAGASWDKLESIFEARVERALNKLGVPSKKDIETLIKRIDELSSKASGAAAAKPARKAAKKAPAKRAAKAAPKKAAA